MRNEPNNQLAKVDTTKMFEMIRSLNLSDLDKQELVKQIASDDIEVRKNFQQKLADSGVAQQDIGYFLDQLTALKKEGMYATTTLKAKTGSGEVTMQFKGGDTKLIIPVLIIVGVVIIAALVILFWR